MTSLFGSALRAFHSVHSFSSSPDSELRNYILLRHADWYPDHSDEVIEYVATSMTGSIRELEGMINSIVCHAQVKGSAPDISEVRQSLRSFTRPQKNISIKNGRNIFQSNTCSLSQHCMLFRFLSFYIHGKGRK